MKTLATLLLALVAFAVVSRTFAADKPAVILADYQAKAAPVLEKLNETLIKQSAPMAAQLISKGDTTGAEEVTAQVQAKIANEPVEKPHSAAALLFAQYDTARQNLLKPFQAAAYAKIDAALKAAGKDLAIIGELGKARTEIESGAVSSAPAPVGNTRLFAGKSWYTRANSEYHFNKDGTGYRIQKMDFDGKVPFTWVQRPDGIVEAEQRKQPAAQPSKTYFRFDDRKTAFQGDNATNIAAPLEMR